MRRFLLPLLALALTASILGPSRAASTTQFGCSALGGVVVGGVTPSVECTFIVACAQSAQICVLREPRLDVNGTGLVEGSMSSPFDELSCSGTFHCAAGDSNTVVGLSSLQVATFRCAANGVAAFLNVTCSVSVDHVD
jgi:hypothetical protein